jgi:hypothetical protein
MYLMNEEKKNEESYWVKDWLQKRDTLSHLSSIVGRRM